MRPNCGVEGGCDNALVFGEKIVRELVEVADAANHGCSGDDDFARRGGVPQKPRVLHVADHQSETWVVVKRVPNRPVLAEVVYASNLMPGLKELFDKVPANEASGTSD